MCYPLPISPSPNPIIPRRQQPRSWPGSWHYLPYLRYHEYRRCFRPGYFLRRIGPQQIPDAFKNHDKLTCWIHRYRGY